MSVGWGAVYFGSWFSGMRSDNGVIFYPGGSSYEGQWSKNKAEGKGRLYHKNGDVFIGTYNNNKSDGYGTYIYEAIGKNGLTVQSSKV